MPIAISIEELSSRLHKLEIEHEKLKKMVEEGNDDRNNIKSRMKIVENELVQVRAAMESINQSMSGISSDMKSLERGQKDVVKLQNEFISNLWKAIFILLGALTTIFSGVVALFKLF